VPAFSDFAAGVGLTTILRWKIASSVPSLQTSILIALADLPELQSFEVSITREGWNPDALSFELLPGSTMKELVVRIGSPGDGRLIMIPVDPRSLRGLSTLLEKCTNLRRLELSIPPNVTGELLELDKFLPTIASLQSLITVGLKITPTCALRLPSLHTLGMVMSHSSPNIWSGPLRHIFITAPEIMPDPELVLAYLLSYTGLQKFGILTGGKYEPHNRILAPNFYKSVLPQHANHLTALILDFCSEPFFIDLDRLPFIAMCRRLESLSAGVDSRKISPGNKNDVLVS
jgi:hypothetical protein